MNRRQLIKLLLTLPAALVVAARVPVAAALAPEPKPDLVTPNDCSPTGPEVAGCPVGRVGLTGTTTYVAVNGKEYSFGRPVDTVLYGPVTWYDDQEVRRQMAQAMGDKLDEDILGALL